MKASNFNDYRNSLETNKDVHPGKKYTLKGYSSYELYSDIASANRSA